MEWDDVRSWVGVGCADEAVFRVKIMPYFGTGVF